MYTFFSNVSQAPLDPATLPLEIPAAWASQPTDCLNEVFFGAQGQDGFEGMFAFLDDAELALGTVGKSALIFSGTDLNCLSDGFTSFLASSTASGSSSSADASTSAASPADNVKPEATSSRKRTRKDTAPPTKRPKLAEHVTQERPFACGQCEKRFSRNSDLKRHVKGHTGERPHICPICSRAFSRADALSRHTDKGKTCKLAVRALARNRRANPPAVTQDAELPL